MSDQSQSVVLVNFPNTVPARHVGDVVHYSETVSTDSLITYLQLSDIEDLLLYVQCHSVRLDSVRGL